MKPILERHFPFLISPRTQGMERRVVKYSQVRKSLLLLLWQQKNGANAFCHGRPFIHLLLRMDASTRMLLGFLRRILSGGNIMKYENYEITT